MTEIWETILLESRYCDSLEATVALFVRVWRAAVLDKGDLGFPIIQRIRT